MDCYRGDCGPRPPDVQLLPIAAHHTHLARDRESAGRKASGDRGELGDSPVLPGTPRGGEGHLPPATSHGEGGAPRANLKSSQGPFLARSASGKSGRTAASRLNVGPMAEARAGRKERASQTLATHAHMHVHAHSRTHPCPTPARPHEHAHPRPPMRAHAHPRTQCT